MRRLRRSPAARAHRSRESLFVSLVATGIVAWALSPAPSFAPAEAKADGAGRVELTEKRTRTSKTFRNSDGTYTTSISQVPLHFRNGKRWSEIRSRFVPSTEPGFAWENESDSFAARFRREASGEYLRVISKGKQYAFELDGGAGRARANGKSLTYADVLPNADLRYDLLAGAVKETILLKSPDAPTSYRFYLRVPDGASLHPEQLEDGSWAFSERAGLAPVFTLRAARALDGPNGAAAPAGTSSDVAVTASGPAGLGDVGLPNPVGDRPRDRIWLGADSSVPAAGQADPDPHAWLAVTRVGKRFAIDVTVDEAWLRQPGRLFPVELDPTIVVDPAGDASFASCNCYAGVYDRLYIGSSATYAWKAALKFDLSAVPAGATITGASAGLYYDKYCLAHAAGPCTSPTQIDLHRMTAAWSSSSTTPQLQFESAPLASYTLQPGSAAHWMTWDLTSTIRAWREGTTPNFGLLYKAADETLNRGGPAVPSSQQPEPSIRPRLDVTYSGDGVQLLPIETRSANGAQLQWTPYEGLSGAPFERYEIHRSATPGFEPSTATLVATIRDATVTTYRDTTAAPGRTFAYEVVANASPGNERVVQLPADGLTVKRVQPPPATADATFLHRDSAVVNCANYGASRELWVGAGKISGTDRIYHGLTRFDLRDVPTDAQLTAATFSLWNHVPAKPPVRVSVHRATASWQEGTADATCSGDGATWYETNAGIPWTAQGGDFDASALASLEKSSALTPRSDSFDVLAQARRWVDGSQPNHGLLVRADPLPYARAVTDGPVKSWWRFDDPTGSTTAADSSGNSATATYEGGLAPGAPGALLGDSSLSATLDGVDDSLAAGDRFDFAGRAAFTLESWLRPTAIDANVRDVWSKMAWDATTGWQGYHVYLRNTGTGNYIGVERILNNSTYRLTSPLGGIAVGNWYHVAVTYDGTNLSIWVNGNKVATRTDVYSILNTTASLRFGSRSDRVASSFFKGGADEVAAYDKAFTSDQVAARYGAGQKTYSLAYTSDDEVQAPGLRPRLDLTFQDPGSQAMGPRVSLVAPAPGAVVQGVVQLAASAADDRRVDKVEFLLDGQVLGESLAEPWTVNWDSGGVAAGPHNVVVRATDDAGNVTSSTPVAIEVNSAPPTVSVPEVRPAYGSEVRAAAPASYWPLDEAVGAVTASDAVGSRPATIVGAPTIGEAGAIGAAVVFSASTQAAEASYSAALNPAQFSVELWARSNGGTGTPRVAVSSSTGEKGFEVGASSGNVWTLALGNGGGKTEIAGPALVPGRWAHLVGSYDGSTASLYVDGALVGSAPSGFAANDVAPFTIGRAAGGGGAFPGGLDEVALYGRALTATEVKAHFDAAAVVRATTVLSVEAFDDRGVDRVEFLADGERLGVDGSAPFSLAWNTFDAAIPGYDGERRITARVYDTSGNSVESGVRTIAVANTAGTRYRAQLTSTPIPGSLTFDPALATQAASPVDVTVTNRSSTTWAAGAVAVGYRWIGPGGSVAAEGTTVELPAALAPNGSSTVRLDVAPPVLPAGVGHALYRLRFDLTDLPSGPWFAGSGNAPLEQSVVVRRAGVALGLERYYHYDGEDLGAGMQHLANLSSGNSIVRWTPFESEGRGIGTVVDLTYNSLENGSESPAGNNVSLAISSLTRFGSPLDIHPNAGDLLAGRADRYLDLTDGDGTAHRFTSADGVAWHAPAGVNLYLRQLPPGDPTRAWAVTRPDRVTFYFDADGYPTAVVDANGNTLTFTLEEIPLDERVGATWKRVTAVVDPAGQGATPAPQRRFTIEYHARSGSPRAVAGKIRRITGRTGHALEFAYYDDGNLLRLTERGGTNADGSFLADRAFTFAYVRADGAGPAIADPTARATPSPLTGGQSSRLYSVRDPRGAETIFGYVTPTGSATDWRLASRTDRSGATVSYAYDTPTRTTTLAAPASRTSVYRFDSFGRVTEITNPAGQKTGVEWTGGHQVSKVIQPTGRFTEYAYNANGYLTDSWDELRNRTTLAYDNVPVDANDVPANWAPGRSIPHLSQLAAKTDPKGTATPALPDDYRWTFGYDTRGNVTAVTDPLGNVSRQTYNADGTVATSTDPNGYTTTIVASDANGLPTEVRDAGGGITRFGYDADGRLLWSQDPLHATATGANARHYRSVFDYDSFGRLGRQSSPKSWTLLPGKLTWTDAEFDANDNLVAAYSPYYASQGSRAGAATRYQYDGMDRLVLETSPDRMVDPLGERTQYQYDAAGRLTRVTAPKGVLTPAIDADYSSAFTYDVLDRVIRETASDVSPAGTLLGEQRTHYCYDTAGDLRRVVPPRANLAAVDCSAATQRYATSFEYDAAHRMTRQVDPLGNAQSAAYDDNGDVVSATDEAGETTTLAYDQAGRLVKQVEPFDTGRAVTTRYEYDANGNVKRVVSPRAWDASADKQTFTDYVSSYAYDELGRVARIALPTDSATPASYVHYAYDANGNLTWRSLPVAAATPDAVAVADKTLLTYWDDGLVRTSKEAPTARVHFDYTAAGQQALRANEDGLGRIDLSRIMLWTYSADGDLLSNRDLLGQVTSYRYDANGNMTQALEASGLTAASQQPLTVTSSYDGLDRLARVSEPKLGSANAIVSTFVYDAHGNIAEQVSNREETSAGAVVTAGRREVFAYDDADGPIEQIDYGLDSGAADDSRLTDTYWPTGLPKARTLQRWSGSSWSTEQVASSTYFKNGLVRTQTTANGAGDALESHTLAYETASGLFANGNKTRDTFTLRGPDSSAPCYSSACVASWEYDAAEHLVKEADGHGTTTTYALDPAGNVTSETETNGGVASTRAYTYVAQQLRTLTEGGTVKRHWYHADGSLGCVTVDPSTIADCTLTTGQAPAAPLLERYAYDYRSRLAGYGRYQSGAMTDGANYKYDPLDRIVEQKEVHPGFTAIQTTAFAYVGVSGMVSGESIDAGTGAVATTKAYSYDVFGEQVGLTRAVPGQPAERFSLGRNTHGSVSLLVGAGGVARAAYGYRAYGEADPGLTKGDLSATSPLNSYRFSGMRLDSGSGTVDMGARRFSPSTARFLQIDGYADALDDLGLTLDPLTGNRYALAGGNPISFVEVDGHWPRWANPVTGAQKVGGAVKSAGGYCLGRGAGNCALAAAGAGLVATGVGAGAGSAMLVTAGAGMMAGSRAFNAYAGSKTAVSAAKRGDVVGVAMAIGTGGRGSSIARAAPVSRAVSPAKTNGNSLKSTKAQHVYVITDTRKSGAASVHKAGVSGAPLNKNGTSPRAQSQVNKLNKGVAGSPYKATLVSKIPEGPGARVQALRKEQKIVNSVHAKTGSAPLGNKRPTPKPPRQGGR